MKLDTVVSPSQEANQDVNRKGRTKTAATSPNIAPLSVADALRRWIGAGACQSPSGAFCAWRDTQANTLAFEYPEITGYALTYLAGRKNLTAKEAEVGKRAADWLIARLQADNYSAHDGWDNGAVYNFDLAMIANGLMLFGERLKIRRYTKWGIGLVNYLREQIDFEGNLPAVSQKHPVASLRPSSWSTTGQAHLLKAAQCLLLAEHLTLRRAAETAELLVENSKRLQLYNGRFITQPEDSLTMLHPHLYALEGLWIFGTARRDAEALERARTGLRWLWSHQLESGGFPRAVAVAGGAESTEGFPEQFDVTSQAVRMALALGLRLPRLDEAIARLQAIAHTGASGTALVYHVDSPTLHQNMWVTMFGVQALELASSYTPLMSWEELV